MRLSEMHLRKIIRDVISETRDVVHGRCRGCGDLDADVVNGYCYDCMASHEEPNVEKEVPAAKTNAPTFSSIVNAYDKICAEFGECKLNKLAAALKVNAETLRWFITYDRFERTMGIQVVRTPRGLMVVDD